MHPEGSSIVAGVPGGLHNDNFPLLTLSMVLQDARSFRYLTELATLDSCTSSPGSSDAQLSPVSLN